jgi:hypothetical protein
MLARKGSAKVVYKRSCPKEGAIERVKQASVVFNDKRQKFIGKTYKQN